MTDEFPEPATQGKAPWLITLADLALLLVGFFVFLQANQRLDPRTLARGFRDGFAAEAPAPIAMASAAVGSFAAGSAIPGAGMEDAISFARDALRDPRISIRIAGTTDGTPADTDAATGSAELLALDRARAIARMLAEAGIATPGRITIIANPKPGRRMVLLTQGFTGDPT